MSPTEELELEKLFKKAFEQPNLRPEFIEKLLNSNIYFPGQTIDENSIQLTEKNSRREYTYTYYFLAS